MSLSYRKSCNSDYWGSWAEPEIHSTKSDLINPGLDKARLDLKLGQSQKQLSKSGLSNPDVFPILEQKLPVDFELIRLIINKGSVNTLMTQSVDQTPQFFNTVTLMEPGSDYCTGSTNEKKDFKPSEPLLFSSFSTAVRAPSPPAALCLLCFPVLFHSFSPPSV